MNSDWFKCSKCFDWLRLIFCSHKTWLRVEIVKNLLTLIEHLFGVCMHVHTEDQEVTYLSGEKPEAQIDTR